MSDLIESRASGATVALPLPGQDVGHVGLVTRMVSWIIDAVLINVVAIMTGVGTALVLSLFPLAKEVKGPLEAIAGVIYALWACAYFVAFWSTTGQTPGARVMQIRLVTAKNTRIKPGRAVIRWIGMNLAMLPLFAGFIPIPFGRRGFPDWLAHTLVLDAPQLSLAGQRRVTLQAGRDRPAAIDAPEVQTAPSAPATPDGGAGAIKLPESPG